MLPFLQEMADEQIWKFLYLGKQVVVPSVNNLCGVTQEPWGGGLPQPLENFIDLKDTWRKKGKMYCTP